MRTEYDSSKGKRGALIPQPGKTRITIYIDNAVLNEFRARAERTGTGYQTMMNEALKDLLGKELVSGNGGGVAPGDPRGATADLATSYTLNLTWQQASRRLTYQLRSGPTSDLL